MLIFPPIASARITNNICEMPMGIASLAAYLLEHAGVEVSVLDAAAEGYENVEPLEQDSIKFGLSYDDIEERIRAEKPDLVGLSTIFSSQFPFVREIARRARAMDPDLHLVTGGTYPSFMPEHALESTELDAVVIGEGELPFTAMIERINQGKGLEGLPALAYKENGPVCVRPARTGREVMVNSRHWMVDDLDSLPVPARDLFPIEKYFKINMPMQIVSRNRRNLPIVTSRGCPYRCRFCSSTIHWGHKYRTRSVEKVLEEMALLKDKYNVKELKFEDDNLTFDRERAKALFKGMIEQGFNFLWNTPNGIAVRHLDDEMLSLMKRSGCYELTLAIESGDPEVLRKIIKKPLDLDEARNAAKRIKKHGIGTAGYFIIGLPGEKKSQVENTVRFARELNLDRLYIFLYTPLPGTPLAEEAIKNGLVREDFDFEKGNHYFLPMVRLPDMSWDELLTLQRRAFLMNNIRLLFTRPHRFLARWGVVMRDHPDIMLKFLRAIR